MFICQLHLAALSRKDVPTPSTLKHWDHLNEATRSMEEFNSDIPFALMIGGNCPKGLQPMQVISSEYAGSYAYHTLLGWCVVGPMNACTTVSNHAIKCNLVKLAATTRYEVNNIATGNIADHHFTDGCIARDNILSNKLYEMYQAEFNEVNTEEKGMSQEDKQFLKILNSGIQKIEGKYEVPLPFRHESITLPNNKLQATYRLQTMKKKMQQNDKFRKDYVSFMESLIAKGHAKKCSNETVTDGKLWYLPHHGVYQSCKPKIRIVFDCSARFKGRSLNDELLQGPDLANHLVGVLLKFRKDMVPFTADIEAMFHQIRVPPSQRSFLRFLWWPGGDFSKPMEEFEMCAHTFGAISSPSCAHFTLKHTAYKHSGKYGDDACEAILRNFYVDDLLKSSKDDLEAAHLLNRMQLLCSEEGGFNLTKVMSSSMFVLNSVSPTKRAAPVQKLTLGKILPADRALGV